MDLEKWLSDSLVTNKGSFFEESLGFLKESQCLTSSEDNGNRLSRTGAASSLHSWTASVIVKVLQANAWRADSKTVSDEIEKLHISSMHGDSYQQSDEVHGSSSLDTHSVDVKAEANYYFQCMFSEQLTVDEMVQMLAHFKGSSEKREQYIFKCIISILLEEYKFFPNYPQRQLGLAAVLFGSVIKCQLVTHLTLGIALRCVLGGLRKVADSKISLLLTEWYQICKVPGGNDDLCAKFVSQLYQNGLLRGDDLSDHFFHYLLNLSVSHWKLKQSSQPVQSSFFAIDIYSKLVFSILKVCASALQYSRTFYAIVLHFEWFS